MPWKCKQCGSREVLVETTGILIHHWTGDEVEGSEIHDVESYCHNDDPELPISVECADYEKKWIDKNNVTRSGCGNKWIVGNVELLQDHFERVEK